MLPIDLVIAMAFIGKVPKSQRASSRLGWVVRLPLSLKKACEPRIKLGAAPIVVKHRRLSSAACTSCRASLLKLNCQPGNAQLCNFLAEFSAQGIRDQGLGYLRTFGQPPYRSPHAKEYVSRLGSSPFRRRSPPPVDSCAGLVGT